MPSTACCMASAKATENACPGPSLVCECVCIGGRLCGIEEIEKVLHPCILCKLQLQEGAYVANM